MAHCHFHSEFGKMSQLSNHIFKELGKLIHMLGEEHLFSS